VLFQLEDVTKTYGPVTALNQLSVAAPSGAIGLLGPNGSGKTTMIRALLGLISLDSGAGSVLGMDISRRSLDVRREVGFAPENECLFPHVVGIGFVAYAGELVGMRHVLAATVAEHHKLGRRVPEHAFLPEVAQ